MQNLVIGSGHNTPPLTRNPAPWLAGARALIRRRKRPIEMAGRAHTSEWILSFKRCMPPEIDELMGWTGGDDMLATEVQLTFASRDAAVAYAERQGLDYHVEAEPQRASKVRFVSPMLWTRSGRQTFRSLAGSRPTPRLNHRGDETAPPARLLDQKRPASPRQPSSLSP
jgi:hypothetical protein